MRVTQKIVDEVWSRLQPGPFASTVRPALEAALEDVPDVKPFLFTGYEGRPVFIHGSCGTIIDVDPAHAGIKNSTFEQVRAGECDCENTGPWFRVYVGEQA